MGSGNIAGNTLSQPMVAEAPDTAAREHLISEVVEDDEFYRSTYGLSLAEAQQTVRYGDQEKSLGEVLAHPKCPLGGWIEEAHQAGGRAAVEAKLNLFGQMATEFRVELDNPEIDQKKN
jgi:hypothetical protein